jgi:hypothetical protein
MTGRSSAGSASARGAVDDRVRRAQDAEERPSPAAVLVGALDQPGISTSCTSTPPMRVSAGIGRRVVNG